MDNPEQRQRVTENLRLDLGADPVRARSWFRSHLALGAAILVVVVGCGLTFAVVRQELRNIRVADQEHFDRLTEKLKGELSRRVIVYNYGLMGSRSLFPASEHVERDEFREMVFSHELETEFPGALGIGFIRAVEDEDAAVESFIANAKAEGAEDFAISIPPGAAPLPGSVMDERLIIEFIEPVEQNRPALGLDIGSHPVRREAAERAARTGRGSITGRIELVQDNQAYAGFLYLLPVYKRGMPTETVVQRLAAVEGWVYMPMIAPPVFDGAAAVADEELTFMVFDGENTDAATLIYSCGQTDDVAVDSDAAVSPLHAGHRFHVVEQLEIGGRTWTVSITDNEEFAALSRSAAVVMGIGGGGFSLLLGLVVYMLGTSARRAHTLASGMTAELRRYAEEAGAATRSKSEFLANMSHEIRTPMTAILGYADLLRDDSIAEGCPETRRKYVGTIKRNGNHLLGVLNDILDISKIEAGKLCVEAVDCDPMQLVRDVASLMAVKSQEKQIALHVAGVTAIPSLVKTDPVRLRQILMNLVGNAIKFTHAGGVTLSVEWHAGTQQFRCVVTDTGIGMSAEQMGRLFQAFEQADTSTTRQFGGSGLGLQITRRLTELMGGEVSVCSELGAGSRFTLTLPMPMSEGAAMIPPGPVSASREQADALRDTPAHGGGLQGVRVLLAEDGVDNQRLIGFHLRRAGAEVTVVENGKLAIEALCHGRDMLAPLDPAPSFDLLLSDMQMPEMDGYTAVRMLRDKGCRLPIVALTAHAMAGDRDRCLAAGCTDYASKPINPEHLIKLCLQALQAGDGGSAAA